ncbi:arginine/ornithine permease [Thermoactinomyces sp. DSM 45891]|nr:arginine/ornithine permease [Thermoactinomyces sp. DSM 45891]
MMETTQNGLKRSMKSRHLFMIALGGVLGTGFFNMSGYAIQTAGPLGSVLAYLIGGLIMYFVMLCLGELSVAMPTAGSFQEYSTRFIGPSHGFVVGWLYWLGWAATVALELVMIGGAMQRWFPDIHIVVWSILFGSVMFLVNAFSGRSFAEAEFWFASIKISAVVLFILIGGAAIFGLIDIKSASSAPLFSNFTKDGLFPTGIGSIFVTMLAVNFAFQGTELIGVAAGESKDPERVIPRAIRQTVWRTILFFGLAMTVLNAIVPFKQAGVLESPFVFALEQIGVPYAADIMNAVVLIALLSVANSGLYAASRMLYSLSGNKMAPKALGKVNASGVPFIALLISFAVAALSFLTYFLPSDKVYQGLMNIAGMTAILSWIMICASQFFFRRKYLAQGGKVENLKYRTPLYPFVPIFGFICCVTVFVSNWFDEATRIYVEYGVPAVLAMYLVYFLFMRKNGEEIKKQKADFMSIINIQRKEKA